MHYNINKDKKMPLLKSAGICKNFCFCGYMRILSLRGMNHQGKYVKINRYEKEK